MSQVVWTPTAVGHLQSVYDFIAADHPQPAEDMVDRILDAAERLAEHPLLGRGGRFRGTRELVIPGTPYLIAYQISRDEVQVLAVFHGARKWPERF